MEDLVAAFSSTTIEANNTSAEHPHFALYKQKFSKSSQAERRRQFLEAQKKKRFDFVNHARKLADNEWNMEEEEDEEYEDEEGMDCDLRPVRYQRPYKDQLMCSEWMIEVPEDLAINWILVLCPIGKRSLVVASKNFTKVYSRSGYLLHSFRSCLPGSNHNEGSKSGYTLLDCIYVEQEKTYYVLDMICWNGYPLYDVETEFRFYWVSSKLKEECPKAMETSKENPFKFVPLPYFSCDESTLRRVLASPLPFPCELDGLLFFHKQVHYIPKRVPLICWLKGFMVPEMLNIDVPESLCKGKPSTYTTMKEHIPKAFERHAKQKDKDEKSMQFEET